MLRRIISYVLILTVLLAAFPVCFAENDPPPYQQDDKFACINQDLDNCPVLMAQNISDMLHENIPEEVEAVRANEVEAVRANIAEFRKASAKLRRMMWWKNPETIVGILGAVVAIVAVIVGGVTWIVTEVKKHKK